MQEVLVCAGESTEQEPQAPRTAPGCAYLLLTVRKSLPAPLPRQICSMILLLHSEQHFFFFLNGVFCITACACCLPSIPRAPQR